MSKYNPERDRTTFQVLRIIRGLKNKEVGLASDLSPSTIRKLRLPVKDGGTRYPRNLTIDKILAAAGYHRPIVKRKEKLK